MPKRPQIGAVGLDLALFFRLSRAPFALYAGSDRYGLLGKPLKNASKQLSTGAPAPPAPGPGLSPEPQVRV